MQKVSLRMKKNDCFLVAILFICAVFAYVSLTLYQEKSTENGVVVVTIDGEAFGTYSLTQDRKEKIELADQNYNVLEIMDGKVRIKEASCPDKICVNHRAISKNGQSIVCLPNRLVVQVVNQQESDVDSFTN